MKGWTVRLEPFGMLFAGLIEALKEKSLKELVALRKDCDQATRTNCWCYTYQAAQFLKKELDERIALKREIAAAIHPECRRDVIRRNAAQ